MQKGLVSIGRSMITWKNKTRVQKIKEIQKTRNFKRKMLVNGYDTPNN